MDIPLTLIILISIVRRRRLAHEALDERYRARFRHSGVCCEVHPRPRQWRPALFVGDVQPYPLNQELDNIVGSSIGRSMYCRETHRVHLIDIHTEFPTELYRFQPGLRALVISLVHYPVDSGRSHQSRGSSESGNLWIGAVLKQKTHDVEISGQGCLEERCHPSEVDPRQ